MSKKTPILAWLFASQLGAALAAEPSLPATVGIVRAELAKGFVPGCSMPELERPDAYWTPSRDQVLGIERRLPDHLAELNSRGDLPVKLSLKGYARQYTGVTYGTKQFYYVYFLPAPDHPTSLSQFYIACDGGPKYWAMLFDPQALSFGDPIFSMSYTGPKRVEKPSRPDLPGNDI